MEKQLKAFIFDVDGVLVDSSDANYESLKKTVKDFFNLPFSKKDEQMLGSIPTSKKLEWLQHTFNLTIPDEIKTEFISAKFLNLLDIADTIVFNHEIKEIFELIKRQDVKIAVVSNARKEYVDFVLCKLNVSSLVDIIVSNSANIKTKPEPDMYLHAMEALGSKPSESVIFEDSEIGLAAARASHGHVVHIMKITDLDKELINKLILDRTK